MPRKKRGYSCGFSLEKKKDVTVILTKKKKEIKEKKNNEQYCKEPWSTGIPKE